MLHSPCYRSSQSCRSQPLSPSVKGWPLSMPPSRCLLRPMTWRQFVRVHLELVRALLSDENTLLPVVTSLALSPSPLDHVSGYDRKNRLSPTFVYKLPPRRMLSTTTSPATHAKFTPTNHPEALHTNPSRTVKPTLRNGTLPNLCPRKKTLSLNGRFRRRRLLLLTLHKTTLVGWLWFLQPS